MNGFSFRRLSALLRKEWIQVRRDPFTLRLIIALPIMQLLLFGYAINTNPKHLATGLMSAEHSKYERTIVAALQNTGYYDIRPLSSEAAAEKALAQGDVLFVIDFPPNFDRSVDRGESPSVLIDADATDPSAIGNATAALSGIADALSRDLPPSLQSQRTQPPFQFVVHARYNPEQLTVLNIVPGLICMVLIMSTLLVTTLAVTRERERGTLENLMAMPVRPIEIMLAKIAPYILIGYIQVLSDSWHFRTGVPIAGARIDTAPLGCARPVHRQQSGAGPDLLDHRDQPDASHPDGAVYTASFVPAVRFFLSVQRHARMGTMARRILADDSRHPNHSRHVAQGQRCCGDCSRTLADSPVHGDRDRHRGTLLSRNARLSARCRLRPAAKMPRKLGVMLRPPARKKSPSNTVVTVSGTISNRVCGTVCGSSVRSE